MSHSTYIEIHARVAVPWDQWEAALNVALDVCTKEIGVISNDMRALLGWSRPRAAEEAGVNVHRLGKIETGNIGAHLWEALALLQAYRLAADGFAEHSTTELVTTGD